MKAYDFSIFGRLARGGIFHGDIFEFSQPFQQMNQVHGTRIVEIDSYCEPPTADALITSKLKLRLAVKTADCIPLVMADEEIGVVAAVHAGWRGLTADIIPLTLQRLKKMGASMLRLKVGVGPSIGTECASFSNPFEEIPAKYHWAVREVKVRSTAPKSRVVDLNGIAQKQLLDAGVRSENIEWFRICTRCHPEWPSWRRDQTTERFWTWIELGHTL